MLWESTDPDAELTRRFRFEDTDAAAGWLRDTLRDTHGISVDAVERMSISSANLLVWATSDAGPLLIKSSVWTDRHPALSAQAEILLWLADRGLPVSAPLRDRSGQGQMMAEHLTIGVQRVIDGEIIDPHDEAQAISAGQVLADLHRAFADYPGDATAFNEMPSANRGAGGELHPSVVDADAVATEMINDLQGVVIPVQTIHNDFRGANILVNNRQVAAVLDFEEMTTGRRIDDVSHAAVTLSTRFRTWEPTGIEAQDHFLAAYRERYPLSTDEDQLVRALILRATAHHASGGRHLSAWQESLQALLTRATHRNAP